MAVAPGKGLKLAGRTTDPLRAAQRQRFMAAASQCAQPGLRENCLDWGEDGSLPYDDQGAW